MTAIERAVQHLGSQQKLAAAARVSPQAVSFWVSGERRISGECAVAIETATNGAVTRQDLRPDLFGEPPAAANTDGEPAASVENTAG